MLLILVGLCFGAVYGANHGHHGGHGYVTASPENVDSELHGLHTHFGQHLCLDLLLVDCSKHPISGDEVICGSDGLEYKNHCSFVHAACKFDKLTIAKHGPCGQTSAPAGSTAALAGSTAAQTAAPVGSTAAPAGSTAAPITASPGVSTTMMDSTTIPTTTPKPTIDPSFLLIKNVFCTNKDGISCLGKIEFMCGTDGNLYPNSCEFSKAKCDDNYLTTQDLANCPGAPTVATTSSP